MKLIFIHTAGSLPTVVDNVADAETIMLDYLKAIQFIDGDETRVNNVYFKFFKETKTSRDIVDLENPSDLNGHQLLFAIDLELSKEEIDFLLSIFTEFLILDTNNDVLIPHKYFSHYYKGKSKEEILKIILDAEKSLNILEFTEYNSSAFTLFKE